ncbi:M28 family peptidase [Candidatus Bipolaricaulota bacterium]
MSDTALPLLEAAILRHLNTLCTGSGNRHVGSPGNRRATDYFCQTAESFGFAAECAAFDCLEWESGEVFLQAGKRQWEAFVAPYSLPCDVKAELCCISTLDELAEAEIEDKIVLLYGEIASEPIMPKSFVFYNPEHHQRLIALLESKQPAAVIAATGKHPGTAGSLYPFPLFEDGDFDIPSAFMKDIEGARLTSHRGEATHLKFESRRIPATACNPVARKKTDAESSVLICAHIDAKKNTPGALDNAAGVAVLLALAELLAAYDGSKRIELVAFNGEDYYSVPGQMHYLSDLGCRMGVIDLVINLDGAGHKTAGIAYSFYNCDEDLRQMVASVFTRDPLFVEGVPWSQGDHSMFTMAGCPAIAITSTNFDWLCQEITHTLKDSPDLVDSGKLAKTACAIHALLTEVTT